VIVYLDTNIVIYAVEGHPVFGPRVRVRLASAQVAGDTLMISDLTRMECLVGPLRASNAALEAQFRAFFATAGLRVVPISPAVCDRAALIRAITRFKPMDALQLAAAVEHAANVFLTNDTRLNTFTGLSVEVLT
jgi:predicted nucleic acid-binding protein